MGNKVIFVFLDGVGVDSENENNPFSGSDMKFVKSIVGASLLSANTVRKKGVVFRGLDACLGVKGIPQSATGQTALFTGINAQAQLGYHLPAFPNKELIKIIEEQSIYRSLLAKGKICTFANAYAPDYTKLVKEGKRKHSVTTIAALYAGLPFRRFFDLKEGRAVYWDITNSILKDRFGADIDVIDPFIAGKNLQRLTDSNDLVVFESFLPDIIGHKCSMEQAIDFCSTLDKFICGIVSELGTKETLVIGSDHGNFEDLSSAAHTRNPSLLLAIGAHAYKFYNSEAITDIKGKIVEILSD